MMEMDVVFRLSMMVGFLSAGFLALLIALCVGALRRWCGKAKKELDEMIESLETMEESGNESKQS